MFRVGLNVIISQSAHVIRRFKRQNTLPRLLQTCSESCDFGLCVRSADRV